MLRSLVSAFLVCRLELRQLPVDLDLLLSLWRHRPAIEIVLRATEHADAGRQRLLRRLDEVYPF